MTDPPLPPRADYESTPLSRSEYIAAIVHLYRGELYRSNTWRLRLDTTTNWAVLTTAGLLSFSFGPGQHSHWILLLGLAVVSLFLAFEARRFRFWHVWRSRVRMIEENFYGPILRRDPVSPEQHWGEWVAADLFHPRFKIGRLVAIRARLSRNYWAIYFVLVTSWIVKVLLEPDPASSWTDIRRNLELASGGRSELFLPWWIPLLYVGVFLAGLLVLVVLTPGTPKDELEYWGMDDKQAKRPSPFDL